MSHSSAAARFVSSTLALFALACSADLRVPKGRVIACQSDAQCPTGMRCSASIGECVAGQSNQAPGVALGPIGRGQSVLEVTVTVYDAEGDVATLAAELVSGGQASALAVAPSSVAGTPDGAVVRLSFDPSVTLGDTRYRDGLTLVVTPRDPTGIGATVASAPFDFGNDPPRAEELVVIGEGGVLRVEFRLADSSADLVELTDFEYSLDGFVTSTAVPLDATSFPDSDLTALETSAVGAAALLAWNSSIAAPLPRSTLQVRLRVTDVFGASSDWATSPPFQLDNAPAVTLSEASMSARQLTTTPFVADVVDPNLDGSETATVAVAYTTDPPESASPVFHPLTLHTSSASLTDLSSPGPRTAVWDTLANAQAALGLPLRYLDVSDGESAPRPVVGFVPSALLRAVATDSAGLISAEAFVRVGPLGNDAPEAAVTTVPDTSDGEIPIQVSIKDSSFDPVDLEVQFRRASDVEFRVAAIVLSNVAAMATSPSGASHLVLWDSSAALAADVSTPQGVGQSLENDVELRVRAIDYAGATHGSERYYGAWSPVATISELANQSAPRIEDVRFERLLRSDGASPVVIRYRVIDDESDPVDVRFELSFDNAPYEHCSQYPALRSEGTTRLTSAPAPGVEHVFVWDATGDRIVAAGSVQLRVSATDGLHPDTTTTEPLLPRTAQPSLAPPDDRRYVESASLVNLGEAEVFVEVGDVTGDGILDIVSVENTGPTMQVHIGQGSGGVGNGAFGPLTGGQWYTTGTATTMPRDFALVDLDADGMLDVLTANSDGTLSFRAGRATAGQANDSFEATSFFTVAGASTRLEALIVDRLDSDEHLDVAVTTSVGDVLVLLGDGDAGPPYALAVAHTVNIGVDAAALVALDVDGDGDLDLAVTSINDPKLAVLTNELDEVAATFTLAEEVPLVVFGYPMQMAALELDGDARLDLAVSLPGTILTLRSRGAPPYFALDQALLGPVWSYGLVAGDLNDDGAADLLSTEYYLPSLSAGVSAYLGRGRGLSTPQRITTGLNRATTIATGDFNADRLRDLAFVKHDHVVINGSRRSVRALLANGVIVGAPPFLSAPHSVALTGVDASPTNDRRIRAGDFDGDGIADLAFGGYSFVDSYGVGIMFGQGALGGGSGAFSDPVANFAGEVVVLFDVSDFDRDGLSDLVFVRGDAMELVVALARDGGTFPSPIAYPLDEVPSLMVLTDLTQDGVTDLVLNQPFSTGLVFFAGTGTGTFTGPTPIATGSDAPGNVVASDFDDDGAVDLMYRRSPSPTSLIRGTGAGTFDAPELVSGVTLSGLVTVADLNHDGIEDLFFSGGGFATPLTVHLGQGAAGVGDATFAAAQTYGGILGVASPWSSWLMDVNQDEVLDIVTLTLTKTSLTWYAGLAVDGVPTGTFSAGALLGDAPTLEPASLAVADFNGDELPDFAVIYRTAHLVTRWFGQRQVHGRWAAQVGDEGLVRAWGSDVSSPQAGLFDAPLHAPTVVLRVPHLDAREQGRDFWSALRRSPLILPPQLRALTAPRWLDGTRRLRLAGERVALENRFGPSGAAGRAGLDVSSGRGLVVSLPIARLTHDEVVAAMAAGKIHVYRRAEALRTSDEVVEDPTEDPTLLPERLRTSGERYDQVTPRVTWQEIALDEDNDLATGDDTGERFVVTLEPLPRAGSGADRARGRVQVLVDQPGILQAFVEP